MCIPCCHFPGAGSTALHYAACGGNPQCCQVCLQSKKKIVKPKMSYVYAESLSCSYVL